MTETQDFAAGLAMAGKSQKELKQLAVATCGD
jgi:TPP-dependent pyruvate/acetoin dehydrogenase alpha subunit